MAEPNTANQNNFKNRQKYKIDIKAVYYSYIKPQKPLSPNGPIPKGIDDFRSDKSVTTKSKSALIKALTDTNTLNSLLEPADTVQESRCHAFYRMIGFPVYDGTNFYNPGYDSIFETPSGAARKLNAKKKSEIAINCINGTLAGFIELSNARESSVLDFLSVFKDNTSITASVLALSSSTRLRKFVAPLENLNGDALAMDITLPAYKVDITGQVGKYKPSLLEYIGPSGSKPASKPFISKRKHVISPFLVDPRYSESVSSDRQMSVPFVLKQINYKVSDTVTVIPPMIESVIRNRLTLSDTGTSGQLAEIKDYVANIPSIKDETLVKKILSDYKLTEQEQFLEYINIMRAMIVELITAQKVIDRVQKDYYWIPIPSSTGPEAGVAVRDIVISTDLAQNPTFITELDKEQIISTIEKISSQTAASLGYQSIQTQTIFPTAAAMFNPDINDGCGSNTVDSVQELSNNRDAAMKDAGKALRMIEIIMGEFSGLGLCDILAIVASLYIIPADKLLGFLDEDAFDRMKSALNLPDASRDSNLTSCLNELTNTVKDFYNLMDKLYLDARQNNGLT